MYLYHSPDYCTILSDYDIKQDKTTDGLTTALKSLMKQEPILDSYLPTNLTPPSYLVTNNTLTKFKTIWDPLAATLLNNKYSTTPIHEVMTRVLHTFCLKGGGEGNVPPWLRQGGAIFKPRGALQEFLVFPVIT